MRPPGTAPRVVYRRQPKYPQSMGRNTPGLTLPPPASNVEAPSVWSRQSDAFLKGRKCLRCTSREVCRRIGTPLSDEVHDHTNKNIPFYVRVLLRWQNRLQNTLYRPVQHASRRDQAAPLKPECLGNSFWVLFLPATPPSTRAHRSIAVHPGCFSPPKGILAPSGVWYTGLAAVSSGFCCGRRRRRRCCC